MWKKPSPMKYMAATKLPVYPLREYFHDESSFWTDMDEAVSKELSSEMRMLTSRA